jgi:outer membrane protein OmpA-like peptidoglycan-associated protein
MPVVATRISTISLIVVVGLAAGPALSQVPAGLRESPPVVCVGMDDIVLHGRYIETDGNGVEVQGNCNIEVIGSHIVAGGVGVFVAGNGDVTVTDSYVEGARGGLVVASNGDIEYRNSTIRGGTRVAGNGDIIDLGGNDVDGFAGSDPVSVEGVPADVSIGPGGIRVVDSQGNVVTTGPGGVRVETRDEVVDVTPGGVHARSEGEDVHVSMDGRVTVQTPTETVVVDGGYVSIRPGSAAGVYGDWRTITSSYTTADTAGILVDLGGRESDGKIEVNLAGDVLFDFNSADVRPEAASQLSKLAHLLRERAVGDVYVEGHTDSVGDDVYNHKLSEQRAVSVMHWLNMNESIPAHLMRGRGHGADKPIAYNTMPDGADNPEGRAKNRRVEIKFASR